MCCYDKHGNEIIRQTYTSTLHVTPDRYCRCLGKGRGIAAEPYTSETDGECCKAIDGEDGLCSRCRLYCNNIPQDATELADLIPERTHNSVLL